MRIGFCLIGHQAHVRHILPIAISCLKQKQVQVEVIVTSDEVIEEVNRVLAIYGNPRVIIKKLRAGFFKRWTAKIKKKLYVNNASVVNKNKNYFLGFDALVTAHHNLDHIMAIDSERRIKYICTMHGTGDGPLGFDKRFCEYDLLMSAGNELNNRFLDTGLVHESNESVVVGYVKFETVEKTGKEKLFKNSNKTIVYNPHHDKGLSSWWLHGMSILKWFANNPQYNLVFAPHIKVFNGVFNQTLSEFMKFDNIHIDVGSESLFDCKYTLSADIYLGDVSSQVYEFLGLGCRPCVFLNSHENKDWQRVDDYKCWRLGDVVQSVETLSGTLENAFINHEEIYKKLQEKAVKEKFYKPKNNQAVSEYAAEKLVEFILGK